MFFRRSALSISGVLDYAPALSTNLNVDDTGNTFAGVLNGRVKVYIDPYASADYLTVGYRGSNPYDWIILLPIRSITNGSCSW